MPQSNPAIQYSRENATASRFTSSYANAEDHPDRMKMARFSAKLRKLGLREETIGHGPSKEKWEALQRASSAG